MRNLRVKQLRDTVIGNNLRKAERQVGMIRQRKIHFQMC